MLQRFSDLPDQGLYGVIGVLAVIALYVIGFVIKNSKNVSVDFVLFSAGVPLITLMVVMLLFGALLGVALTLVLARRRAPATAAQVHRPRARRRRRDAGHATAEHPAAGRHARLGSDPYLTLSLRLRSSLTLPRAARRPRAPRRPPRRPRAC